MIVNNRERLFIKKRTHVLYFIKCIFLLFLFLSCSNDENVNEPTKKKCSDSPLTISNISLKKSLNPTLNGDIEAVLVNNEYVIYVPFGTNSKEIKLSIITSRGKITPDDTVIQDFTNPITYTLTDPDGDCDNITFTVKIVVLKLGVINSFRFNSSLNPSLNNDVIGDITGTTISVKLPEGVDLKNLIPSIEYNGITISPVNESNQDFTKPVIYKVISTDQKVQEYTVIVTNKKYDIYLVGVQQKIIKVWKNGIETHLTDGIQSAGAYSIVVIGANVYVAGYETNGKYDVAKVWKNGVATPLTDGKHHAIVFSMIVVGSDLYVGGYEYDNSNRPIAKLWKNGIPITLTDGSKSSSVFSIAVIGTDLYAAGYENNGFYDTAKLWKNGSAFNLSNGFNDSRASCLFVFGNDVYVGGNDGYAAIVWKNGVATPLTDGIFKSSVSSIFVDNKNFYAAGYEYYVGYSGVRLWKNGNLSGDLISPEKYNNSFPSSLLVVDNNTYVTVNTQAVGKLWKNDKELFSINKGSLGAMAIVER